MKLTETAGQKLRRDCQRYLADYRFKNSLFLLLLLDFWPVVLLRLDEYARGANILAKPVLTILVTLLRPVVNGFSGSRIFSGVRAGGGLLLHTSPGVVITTTAIIGNNCTMFSGAAILHKANNKAQGAAIIGNNVKLMSGCKIIGPVHIGDDAIIAANAVVLHDVPPGALAAGVPAVIKRRRESEPQ